MARPKGTGKSKLDPVKEEIVFLLRNGATLSYCAKRFNTSPINLSNYIRRRRLDVAQRF
jgi:hypothetical protein